MPDTWEQLLRLITVLHFDRSSWVSYFARLFHGAQEN